jgi:hypothetical protein
MPQFNFSSPKITERLEAEKSFQVFVNDVAADKKT